MKDIMSSNPSQQKSTADPKPEAISSLVLGVITIIAAAFLNYYFLELQYYYPSHWVEVIIMFIACFSLYWGWLFSIVGLTLGILGLKSVRKKLAIAGTVLSSIALITAIFMIELSFESYLFIG